MSFEFVSVEPANDDDFQYRLTDGVKQNLDNAIKKIGEYVKERDTWMPNMGYKRDALRNSVNSFILHAEQELLLQDPRPKKYNYFTGDTRNIDKAAFAKLIKDNYGVEGVKIFCNVMSDTFGEDCGKKKKKRWGFF